LAGWHIRPKGVKKPFNPILGEFFRCEWIENDSTRSYFLSEQVSHHPPISAFCYCNPANGTLIYGELRPKAKFLGNSAATLMEGGTFIYTKNDSFQVTNPNVYARSILFGNMFMELGDFCTLESLENNYSCKLDFKQKVLVFLIKGFFSNSDKDGVTGQVTDKVKGESLYKISGKWSAKTIIVDKSGKETVLFDQPKFAPPDIVVKSEAEQEEFESRRYIKTYQAME
jgi:hypothetical protein